MNDEKGLARSIWTVAIRNLYEKDSRFEVFRDPLDIEETSDTFWLIYPKDSEVHKLNKYVFGELKLKIQEEIRSFYDKDIKLKIRYRDTEQEDKSEIKPKTTESAKEQDDFIGKKLGHLTVIELDHVGRNGGKYYKFKCDCGNEIVRTRALIEAQYKRTESTACSKQCPYCNGIQEKIDEVGNVYGKLTVLNESKHQGGTLKWLCKCECGHEVWVKGTDLRNGVRTSCGHCDKADLVGRKFGNLTVIKVDHYGSHNAVYYKCKCGCGNEAIATYYDLVNSHITSCGCGQGKKKQRGSAFPRETYERTEIGKRIFEWIDKHNFSFKRFGKLIGRSGQLIGSICKDPNYSTSYETLIRIADVMGCTLEELVKGTKYEHLLNNEPTPKQLQIKPKQNNSEPLKDSFTGFACSNCLEVSRTSLKIDGKWTPYIAEYCPHCGSPMLTEQQQDEIKRLVQFGMTEQNAMEYIKQAI